MTELDPAQGKLLGALTLTALKHLAGDTVVIDDRNNLCPWRMARVGDEIALVAKPADDQPPRIDCYRVVEHSESGAAFKLDPSRLLFSLRWQHRAHPPDFDLVLLQDEPQHWVGPVAMTLLAELRRRAPHAIEWDNMGDVVPMLDAFEAATDSRTAGRLE